MYSGLSAAYKLLGDNYKSRIIDRELNLKRKISFANRMLFENLSDQHIKFWENRFENSEEDIFSDGTLQILSSNLIPKFQVKFEGLFPYSLTTMTFDATDTDIEYFTAEASFKYTIYSITDLENKPL